MTKKEMEKNRLRGELYEIRRERLSFKMYIHMEGGGCNVIEHGKDIEREIIMKQRN